MYRPYALAFAFIVAVLSPVVAQEDGTFSVGEGKLTFTAPKEWKKVKPTSRIVDIEYQITPVEGETQPGRMTVMGAGGTLEANIERWYGQFEQTNGKATSDVAKVQKLSIAGHEVHYVDISGTYNDQPGPFTPGVKRPNHRMLAAIVLTKDAGNYYLKFHAPQGTVEKNEKLFRDLVDSMKVAEKK